MIKFAVETEFDYSGEEYRTLFDAAGATAFQHPAWLSPLVRDVMPSLGAQILSITGRLEDTGELVAVVPLVRRVMHGITLVECVDFGVTDYTAPVIRRDREADIFSCSNLPGTISHLIAPCDILRVKSIRTEHCPAWVALTGAEMKPAGFAAHSVELSAPYRDWRLSAFGKSHARYLDRKRKRLEKGGTSRFEHITDPQAAGHAINELARMRAGRFENDPIQDPTICSFYTGLARRGAQTGLARTYRLTEAGETAGIVFGVVHQGVFHYLLIGCDYDRFGKHSPGLLMYDSIMEDWLGAGGRVFDFTIGDEPFKAKFGTSPTAIFTFTKPMTLRGRLALAAKAASRGITGLRMQIQAPPIVPRPAAQPAKKREDS